MSSPYRQVLERVVSVLEAAALGPVRLGLTTDPDELPMLCVVPGTVTTIEGGIELRGWSSELEVQVYGWVQEDELDGGTLAALDLLHDMEQALQVDRTLGLSAMPDWRVDTLALQGQSFGGGELHADRPALAVVSLTVQIGRSTPDPEVL